jgi:hypothetical protein
MNKDTAQKKLERMSAHFDDIGIYTKANYCLDIADYITDLEKFRDDAFRAHPNIDHDIETLNNN